VIPAIFASSLLLLPATVTTFSGPGRHAETGASGIVFQAYLGRGQPLQLLLFGGLIVFFTYFYTANVSFKSDDVADNLRKQGGFVPGIRPGRRRSSISTTSSAASSSSARPISRRSASCPRS
jgi:preprotein translocase subunit SecY